MDAALDGLESPPILERSNGVPEEVRAHFDGCPACRGQWHLLSRAEAVLRAPRIVPAPAGMLAEFRDRLAAEARHAERRPVNPFTRWLWPMGSLAAAGMAAAFVISMNPQRSVDERPVAQSPSAHTTRAKGTNPAPREAIPSDRLQGVVEKAGESKANAKFGRLDRGKRALGLEKSAAKATLPKKETGVELRVRPGGGEKPSTPELYRFYENGRSAPAPLDIVNDANVSEVAPSTPAVAPKVRSETKSIREAADRFNKQAAERRMAKADTDLQDSPQGAAGMGGGLGGFGAAVAGNARLRMAAPAGPKASGDTNNRGVRLENVDRAALLEERESLLAAEVSPALVTALQRPVSLDRRGPENVLTVLGRLSREADIEVQLEGKVSQLALSLQASVKQLKKDEMLREKGESQVPLWVALQSVALQGKLEIVPEENRLVLRPIEAKVKGAPNKLLTRQLNRPQMTLKEEVRIQREPLAPTLAKPAAPGQQAAAKPVPANEPRAALFAAPQQQAQNLYYFAYPELPNPDPRVWPSMWGDLPKWLFTLPEERPEKAAAADTK